MNFDFSIESSIAKIQNSSTKEYFREVYQTFANSNYRSSTVMLYSVLICDLVYKLRDLRDIYSDPTAKKILEEIEAMQKKSPTSPEWESKLVGAIKERTSLLESSDIVAIESLQKFRHLSAHPVLNNADLLYSPNKETIQALIRNILEGVLANPPFFSNKIFDTMLADLAEVKDQIADYENLEHYVQSRYLKRLKDTDFRKLFRSLWKVVFITNDIHSNENRAVNYKVLKIFITHNKQVCLELLKNEATYYSNINGDENIGIIIKLLALFPDFFNHLDPSLKLLIQNKMDSELDYYLIGWFVKPSLKEHLTSIDVEELGDVSLKIFNYIKSICNQNGLDNELIEFAIEYFGASGSFESTRKRYNNVIEELVNEFDLIQTKKLLALSNKNSQIYQRIGMKAKLKRIAERFDEDIARDQYKNIFIEK